MYEYARNAYAVDFLNVEQCPCMRRHMSHARCLAELIVQPAADAVHILVLDAHADQVIDLLEQELRIDGADIACAPLHALAFLIELIANIADNLLDDVLDRHHPRRAAVLIDNNREL